MNLHVPVIDPVVTRQFGFGDVEGQKRFHNGVNFVSRSGDTRVFAIARGNLIRDIESCEPVMQHIDRSHWSGNCVAVEHYIGQKKYYALYVHLLQSSHPHEGLVHPGFELGRYAEEHSRMKGPYLHLTLLNESGHPIDPAHLFETAGIPARVEVAC